MCHERLQFITYPSRQYIGHCCVKCLRSDLDMYFSIIYEAQVYSVYAELISTYQTDKNDSSWR